MEILRSKPATKAAPHLSLDPSDPLYQEEYRARQRHVDVQRRLRQLLDAGELAAAILALVGPGSDETMLAGNYAERVGS
jgi:hypothetical protein